MDKANLIDTINGCIAVAKKFKQILSDENETLRRNELEKIAEMNDEKETLLKEYAAMKERVCHSLDIPKKRFDQVDIEQHIKKIAENHPEVSPLMNELWELQHHCHNQFIINRNVIAARMQFLNKTIQQLTESDRPDELLYTKSGNFEYEKSSFGETSV